MERNLLVFLQIIHRYVRFLWSIFLNRWLRVTVLCLPLKVKKNLKWGKWVEKNLKVFHTFCHRGGTLIGQNIEALVPSS